MENSFDKLPQAVQGLYSKLEQIEKLLNEKTQDKQDELLSVEECAKFLRVKTSTIYVLNSKGVLPYLKRSKKCYYYKSDILKYLEKGRRKTTNQIIDDAEDSIAS
tara:strand:- start:27 stop:341 length:315 start_codon:yes stop_codon:yes gene_type:complete